MQRLWADEQSLAAGVMGVAGVDEAGRGCLAGPVFAAAVILGREPNFWLGIRDSKTLTKAGRHRAYHRILEHAEAVSVGQASAREIDERNILQASLLAMQRALAHLRDRPAIVLVDGPWLPERVPNGVRAIPVVDGDARCLSIAAASIVAKVTRDEHMATLALRYPQYGFERHFGYGTAHHLQALRTHGPSVEHRKSFAPVRNLLQVARSLGDCDE